MKKIFYTIIAASLMLGACHPTYVVQQSSQPAPAPVAAPEVSYQNFYDELSPYGHWIDYPEYGYVWMPAAGPDFRPYATNGYWLYTDMGWTWTSNYSWGWAPFHYGRWFYEGGYGWMWIPGNEWSPAWVSWRTNNDYYGWAPLGPNVRMDVYGGSYNPPSNYWCFVPHQYISNPRVSNYYVNETRNVTIINNTTIINARVVNVTNNNNTRVTNNRTVYVNGPDRQEVERVTGSQIRPAVIRENNRPGEQVNNGQYTIYRPHVNANEQRTTTGNQTVRVAPSRVESLRDIRPASSSSANVNAQANNNSVNNNAPSNNNTRPSENPQASNIRTQQNANNNQPVNNNNRFNNNNANTAPSNNNNVRPSSESLPAADVRSQQNVNNNQPLNSRTNNNANTTSQPVYTRPVDTRKPANDGRPANNTRVNTTANNAAPANNSRATNNNVRTTNGNASQNKNKSANEINQMRKANAANPNTTRAIEKKEKKDE